MHKCLFHCVDDNIIFGGDENPTHVQCAAEQTTSLCGLQFVTKEHWNMPHLAVIWRRVIVIICNTKQIQLLFATLKQIRLLFATLKQIQLLFATLNKFLVPQNLKVMARWEKLLNRKLSTQNMDFRQRDPERLVPPMINVLGVEGTMWRGSGVMVRLNGEYS